MEKPVRVLLDNSKVRVLWKFNKRHEFTDEFLDILNEEIRADRVRMSKRIKADPPALLETRDIVVSVHHGGVNCFHEAIGTGIPQEVLPMWIDLYDFAIRVGYLGIGVWGSRIAAPNVSCSCSIYRGYYPNVKLMESSAAFLKVVGDGRVSMRKRALELGIPYKKKPGRITAAHELAKLARLASASASEV